METTGHLLVSASLLPVPNEQEDEWDLELGNVNRMVYFTVIKPRFLGRPACGLVRTLLIPHSFNLRKSYVLFIMWSDDCLRLYNTAGSLRRAGWARQGRP